MFARIGCSSISPVKLRFSGRSASGGLRRWFFILAGLILVPLACLELAYRIELSWITERPPTPIAPLPPLVMRVAALGLLPTSGVETHPIYPWTAVAAIARVAWRKEPPAMSASYLAARNLLSSSGKWRGHVQWVFANWALTTWISRHLTGEEALSTAVATMSFGPGTHGLRDGAQRLFGKRVEQLDAEEVARLMVLTRSPGWYRQPDKWRHARDYLLEQMRRDGIIDDATLLEATARSR
jgi:Transglycosylase